MTMLFDSIYADVLTITARPDLVDITKLAIRHATIRAHTSDTFPKDLRETGVQFETADYLQQLDLGTLPRFRAIKYIRKSDINGNMGEFLAVVDPDNIFDTYHQEKQDRFYFAGETINIKSSTTLQYIVVGYYVNPNTLEATYDSWIANLYPQAITYAAAAAVFTSIGYDEQADRINRIQVPDALMQLKSLYLFQEGY